MGPATGQPATVTSATVVSAAIVVSGAMVSFGTDFLATVHRSTFLVRLQTSGFDFVPAFAPAFVQARPTLALVALVAAEAGTPNAVATMSASDAMADFC